MMVEENLTKTEEIRLEFLRKIIFAEETKSQSEEQELVEKKLSEAYDIFDNLNLKEKDKFKIDDIMAKVYEAMDIQLKIIAKCPYLKLEINEPNEVYTKDIFQYIDKNQVAIFRYLEAVVQDMERERRKVNAWKYPGRKWI